MAVEGTQVPRTPTDKEAEDSSAYASLISPHAVAKHHVAVPLLSPNDAAAEANKLNKSDAAATTAVFGSQDVKPTKGDELATGAVQEEFNPHDEASELSKMLVWWLNSMIALGYRRPLLDEDIPPPARDQTAAYCGERFAHMWQEERKRRDRAGADMVEAIDTHKNYQKYGLLYRSLLRVTKSWIVISGILFGLYAVSVIISPYVIKAMVSYIDQQDVSLVGISDGYALAFVLGGVQVVGVILVSWSLVYLTRMGAQVRNISMDAVYKKALRLSSSARQSSTVGEMVTLMSVDAERMFSAFLMIHWLWVGPVIIVVGLALLVNYIGVSGFAGLAVIILALAGQFYLARLVGVARARVVKYTQERVRLIGEALQGIRVMKYSAWEDPVAQKIHEIRQQEIQAIKWLGYIKLYNQVLVFVTPVFIAGAVLLTFVLLDNELTVTNVFTTLAYVNIMKLPMMLFPSAVSSLMEGIVSAKRLQGFLMLREVHDNLEDDANKVPRGNLILDKASFSWTSTAKMLKGPSSPQADISVDMTTANEMLSVCLHDITLKVPSGALCAIVGPVGAGKSSLLQGILGQMELLSGSVKHNGKFAYVSQEPWIQHATLRENILFEEAKDSKRYKAVIDAACLRKDIAMLLNGDQTEIGERGINLSGGQKARVSLARALYRTDCDIILLDDPLSAVDAHVATQIFEKAILGLLKDKTRLLVMNSHYQFLQRADLVVILEGGRVVASGHPKELEDKFPAYFSAPNEEEEDKGEDDVVMDTQKGDVLHRRPTERSFVESSFRSEHDQHILDSKREDGPGGELANKEEREMGAVTWRTYIDYFRSAGKYGLFYGVIILLGFLLSQVFRTLNDWWLAVWSEMSYDLSETIYMLIYVGLTIVTAGITIFRSVLFIMATVQISYNLHETMFHKILRAPINTFFDVTPVGMIVNRFSKDLDLIDSFLPESLSQFLMNGLIVLGSIIVCLFSSPFMIIVLVPLVILFIMVDLYFRRSSREIKRLESISRTPIFNSFSETLTGLTTIRAFQMQDKFLAKYRRALDGNTRPFFAYWMASRWLAVRLDILSAVVVLCVALFCVAFRDSNDAGTASLALTYSLNLTITLQWTIRSSIMVENSMTSTERILYYSQVEEEAPAVVSECSPPSNWPSVGSITFSNVVMRYRQGLQPVLKGLTLMIKGGEKVGVCGRTGAGKSSVIVCLFRIVEIEAGSIHIDGVDIAKLGLKDLRSRLAIIPQDPVMFSGSIRYNLDPFDEYDDERIWEALSRVHLADEVRKMPMKLHTQIAEGGDNLSLGQRQLICIGRALLKRTKILVMDEATASVDSNTDALIQETIRQNFADRTVITIAHRLETIIDSDRIAVIDAGKVAEYDTPENLLADETSKFSGLVSGLGENMMQHMLSLLPSKRQI